MQQGILREISEHTKPNKKWNRIDRIFTYSTTAITLILSVIVFTQQDEIQTLKAISATDTTIMKNTQVLVEKMDTEISELISQNKSINKGLTISTEQLQQMHRESLRSDTSSNYLRKNNIHELYISNKFLKDTYGEYFFGKWAHPYASRNQFLNFVQQIDSSLTAQAQNNFLNSTNVGNQWYNFSIEIKKFIRFLLAPDYDYRRSVFGDETWSESEYLSRAFEKNETQLNELTTSVDSLLKTQKINN